MATRPTDLPVWGQLPGDTPVAPIAKPNTGKAASGFRAKERLSAKLLNWLFQTIYQWVVYLSGVLTTSTTEIAASGWVLSNVSGTPPIHSAGEWAYVAAPSAGAACVLSAPIDVGVGQVITGLVFSINPGTPAGGAIISPALVKRTIGTSSASIRTGVQPTGAAYTTVDAMASGGSYTVLAGDRLYATLTVSAAVGTFSTPAKFDGAKLVITVLP